MKNKKIEKVELKLHTEFNFGHQKNAENVALALSLAGFYIKLQRNDFEGNWKLKVYTDRI